MPAQPKIYFTRNELLDHSINQRFSFHSVLTERHCYVQKKLFPEFVGKSIKEKKTFIMAVKKNYTKRRQIYK